MRESGLEWVLVRPPRFVNGRGRQAHILRSGDKGGSGTFPGKTAGILIDSAEHPEYVPQAGVVGS